MACFYASLPAWLSTASHGSNFASSLINKPVMKNVLNPYPSLRLVETVKVIIGAMEHNHSTSFADRIRQRREQGLQTSDDEEEEEEEEGDGVASDDSFADAAETLASCTETGDNTDTDSDTVSDIRCAVNMDDQKRDEVAVQISKSIAAVSVEETRHSFILDRFLPAAEAVVFVDNSQSSPTDCAYTAPNSSCRSRSLPRPSSPVRRRSRSTSTSTNTRRSRLQVESDVEEKTIKACGFLPYCICTALSCATNNQQGSCYTTTTSRTISKITEENSGSSDDDDSDLLVQQIKSALQERRAKQMLQQQQSKNRFNSSITALNSSQVGEAVKTKSSQAATETLPTSCFETLGGSSLDEQSTVEVHSLPFKPPYAVNASNGLSCYQTGKNLKVNKTANTEAGEALTADDNLARTDDKVGWPLGISSCYKLGSPRKLPAYKISVLSPPLPKSPAQPWLWKSAPSIASIPSPLSSSPSSSSSCSCSSSSAASSSLRGIKKQLNFPAPSAEGENVVKSRHMHLEHII